MKKLSPIEKIIKNIGTLIGTGVWCLVDIIDKCQDKHHQKKIDRLIKLKQEQQEKQDLLELKEFARSLNNSIEIIPASFKGELTGRGNFNRPRLNIKIKSDFHETWEDCYDDLRLKAYFHNCKVVMDVTKKTETESSGNFVYTLWKCTGRI